MLSKLRLTLLGGSSQSRTVKRNAIGAFVIKIFAMAIQFIQVPIVLSYLDKEIYGVYLTITSIVMWAHNFDFGLGSGLRYKLTEALATDNYASGKDLVSTAYISLTGIMGSVALIFTPVICFLNWNNILNCHNLNNSYLVTCLIVVLFTFLAQFVLDLITIILQANQKTAISTIFRPVANTISVLGVLLLSKFSHNSLLYACIMLTLPLVVILLIANIWLFRRKFTTLTPNIKYYKKNKLKDIYSLGIKFFLSSLSSMVIFSSANLLLSNLINPTEVSIYNTAYTYFAIIIVFHGIILTPFWPAITKSYVNHERTWLKNSMNKLARVTLLFSVGAIIMLFVSKLAYHIWIDDKLNIPFWLSFTICMFAIGNIWSATYNCFIVGVGKAQLTMYLSIVKIIIYLPISISLIHLFGVNGLVISLIVVNTVPNFVLAFIQYHKIITNTAIGIWNK